MAKRVRGGTVAKKKYTRELVDTALRQDKLSGLGEMLRCIAELFEADGCILWEATPSSNFEVSPPTGSLYALAQWFKSEAHWTTYRLASSHVSGTAVCTEKRQHVPDAPNDPRVFHDEPFFERTHVKTFCSIPIRLQRETRGALNLYRVEQRPFSERELDRATELAELVPSLYNAIRDRVSFSFLRALDLLLQQGGSQETGQVESAAEVRQTFAAACQLVGATFQALETSIYLEDRLTAPNRFDLAATTFEPFAPQTSYMKREPGLTPWVLQNARSVHIWDLRSFDEDRPSLDKEYPGIAWYDRRNVLSLAREFFTPRPVDELPPFTFMCSPIQLSERMMGAIRCCTAIQPPYYFAEREVALLELAASRISQFWDNWLRRCETEEENRSLRSLVTGISSMNTSAQRELLRETPNEAVVHDETLRTGLVAISGAGLAAVLLKNEEADEFAVAATTGELWDRLSQADLRHLKTCVLGLGGRQLQSGRALVVPAPFSSALGQTMVVPLCAAGSVYGALEFAAASECEFPVQAYAVAGLLAEQIELYHHLAASLGKSREAQRTLTQVTEAQKQTYVDLGHQMKTPVMTAYSRVDSLLRSPLPEIVKAELLAVRGLLSKAKTVSRSTSLFAQLAEKNELKAVPRLVERQEVVNMVTTAADDQQQRLDPAKEIVFRVQRGGFQVLDQMEIWLDMDLLEQAVSAVLDNAGKYSAPKSRVDVFAGVTGGYRFHITVRNRGLPIRPQDARECIKRGWRGDEAKLVTAEGSGVGLWLVHHIAEAHGGQLLITPTDQDFQTDVRLLLPLRGKRSAYAHMARGR